MAIDTAQKRASAAGVGVVGMAVIYPDANDLEAPQRMASNGLYLGIDDSSSGIARTNRIGIQTGLALGL